MIHGAFWKRTLWWLASTVLMALIQTSWPESLKLQETAPDLVLVLVVFYAMRDGEEKAMFTGLVGGLYQDIAVDTVLGHHVLAYVCVGFLAGTLSLRLVTEHPIVKAGLVFLAGLTQTALFCLIQYLQEPARGLLVPWLAMGVPASSYSALVSPLLFIVAGRRRDDHGIMIRPRSPQDAVR
ncbi:MAG: rod shape-determining protein MreD [Candidatus Hydrogenedentes bacterium]|nr:rod shape-determining protein MreD [Candidatus Hydrogenedentota bacterium]